MTSNGPQNDPEMWVSKLLYYKKAEDPNDRMNMEVSNDREKKRKSIERPRNDTMWNKFTQGHVITFFLHKRPESSNGKDNEVTTTIDVKKETCT